MNRIASGVVLVVVVVLAAAAAAADEPELLAVEARGLLPLEGERTLAFDAIPGVVGVRIGKSGEIRFVSVALDDRDVEVPLEVWQDGRTVRLRLPEGAAAATVRVEATVPAGVGVALIDCGPEVSVMNVDGDLEVVGNGLELQAVGITGSVRVELSDGKIRIDGVGEGIDLDLRKGTGTVARVQGGATVSLRDAAVGFDGLVGEVDLDAERSEVVLGQVKGATRVQARGGKVSIDGADGGAALRMERAPLALTAVRGDVQIDTDGEVRFENCTADLHVNGYGGSLRGTGNEGLVEVKTDGATVSLEKVKGSVRVEGDALRVELVEVGGGGVDDHVWVFTTSSSIVLDNVSSPVRIESEYGDVEIRGAASKVEMVVRDGDVRIAGQNGPVLLRADADRVDVEWVSLAWTEDSRIENERGDVVVHLPAQGGCTLEAASRYGGVESEIDGIRVSDDGSSASGVLRRQARPRVDIVAEGAVRILPAGSGAQARGDE